MSLRTLSFIGLVAIFGIAGCRSRSGRSRESTGVASAAVTAASTPAAAASVPPRRSLKPVGPPHAVAPGMGLGPIMFGTKVANIERHMQMKCEELTPTRCRIITAGVEFALTDGVVSGIQIHRFDRPVEGEPSKLWGVFAGGLPPDVRMTMVPEYVIQSIGAPLKSEVVPEELPNRTVRRDTYNGMVLEYDRNPANNRLMLGEIQIVKKQ